jgi:hypothetical protein
MDALFAVHKLNEAGLKKAETIGKIFDHALTELNAICPAGRELSIVRTKLEEAAFFAKKAMALLTENQS